MKTPRLVLQLLAATAVASAGPAHADAFHGSTELSGTTVGHAKSLLSNLTPRAALTSSFLGIARESIDGSLAGPVRQTGGMAFGRTRVDLHTGTHSGAPMLGNVPKGLRLAAASRAALDHELALLRDAIERVRVTPQVSLGASLKL